MLAKEGVDMAEDGGVAGSDKLDADDTDDEEEEEGEDRVERSEDTGEMSNSSNVHCFGGDSDDLNIPSAFPTNALEGNTHLARDRGSEDGGDICALGFETISLRWQCGY